MPRAPPVMATTLPASDLGALDMGPSSWFVAMRTWY